MLETVLKVVAVLGLLAGVILFGLLCTGVTAGVIYLVYNHLVGPSMGWQYVSFWLIFLIVFVVGWITSAFRSSK